MVRAGKFAAAVAIVYCLFLCPKRFDHRTGSCLLLASLCTLGWVALRKTVACLADGPVSEISKS